MGEVDDSLAPGTILGRYEIRRQLGRGGMGAVYEATHRDLKKRVAVKVLSRALATNEEARQRFVREGEAASRIQHPHVVDVTDVGIDGARPYLVMELLEGEDLASRLARGGALAVREAVDILLPVCAGLTVAHEEGVIHRDLKPENIFLARRRQGGIEPKVLDFGVSKVMGPEASSLTGTSATFGTPYYMPPEQLRGARQADQRSDVYALGIILYECLCGRRPFQADNIYSMLHAIGSGQYLAPRVVRPELPVAVEAVIVRAMRLDPADRPPNVREFAAALLPFASDTVRLLWADTFRADPGQTTPGRRQVSGFDQTVVSDSVPPPVHTPRAFTTLGTATGQVGDGPDPRDTRRMTPLVAIIGGLAVAGGVVAVLALSRSRPPETTRAITTSVAAPASRPVAPVAAPATPATYRVELATEPPGAAIELDGVAIGAAPLRRELPRDGRSHRIVARAPGREPASLDFTDRPPLSPLVLAPVAPAPAARSRTDKGLRPLARAHRDKTPESAAPPPPAAPAVTPIVTPPPPAPVAPRPAAPAPAAPGNRAPVLD